MAQLVLRAPACCLQLLPESFLAHQRQGSTLPLDFFATRIGNTLTRIFLSRAAPCMVSFPRAIDREWPPWLHVMLESLSSLA